MSRRVLRDPPPPRRPPRAPAPHLVRDKASSAATPNLRQAESKARVASAAEKVERQRIPPDIIACKRIATTAAREARHLVAFNNSKSCNDNNNRPRQGVRRTLDRTEMGGVGGRNQFHYNRTPPLPPPVPRLTVNRAARGCNDTIAIRPPISGDSFAGDVSPVGSGSCSNVADRPSRASLAKTFHSDGGGSTDGSLPSAPASKTANNSERSTSSSPDDDARSSSERAQSIASNEVIMTTADFLACTPSTTRDDGDVPSISDDNPPDQRTCSVSAATGDPSDTRLPPADASFSSDEQAPRAVELPTSLRRCTGRNGIPFRSDSADGSARRTVDEDAHGNGHMNGNVFPNILVVRRLIEQAHAIMGRKPRVGQAATVAGKARVDGRPRREVGDQRQLQLREGMKKMALESERAPFSGMHTENEHRQPSRGKVEVERRAIKDESSAVCRGEGDRQVHGNAVKPGLPVEEDEISVSQSKSRRSVRNAQKAQEQKETANRLTYGKACYSRPSFPPSNIVKTLARPKKQQQQQQHRHKDDVHTRGRYREVVKPPIPRQRAASRLSSGGTSQMTALSGESVVRTSPKPTACAAAKIEGSQPTMVNFEGGEHIKRALRAATRTDQDAWSATGGMRLIRPRGQESACEAVETEGASPTRMDSSTDGDDAELAAVSDQERMREQAFQALESQYWQAKVHEYSGGRGIDVLMEMIGENRAGIAEKSPVASAPSRTASTENPDPREGEPLTSTKSTRSGRSNGHGGEGRAIGGKTTTPSESEVTYVDLHCSKIGKGHSGHCSLQSSNSFCVSAADEASAKIPGISQAVVLGTNACETVMADVGPVVPPPPDQTEKRASCGGASGKTNEEVDRGICPEQPHPWSLSRQAERDRRTNAVMTQIAEESLVRREAWREEIEAMVSRKTAELNAVKPAKPASPVAARRSAVAGRDRSRSEARALETPAPVPVERPRNQASPSSSRRARPPAQQRKIDVPPAAARRTRRLPGVPSHAVAPRAKPGPKPRAKPRSEQKPLQQPRWRF